MDNIKWGLSLFIVVILVQLYVPAKMIWDREDVLQTGREYKFKTAPVDPNDPFRGKYIILQFEEDLVPTSAGNNWERDEDIYVILSEDSNGFAQVASVLRQRPGEDQDFVKAKIGYVFGNGTDETEIEYPFERFYMEESKAPEAELTYAKSQRDTTKTTYALVRVKNGEAVLKDVMIDGISIVEIVKTNRANNK